MRDFGSAARAEIEAGRALSVGAVSILTAPAPAHFWGGFGELTIGDDVFVGLGDRGLVDAVATTLGGAEQNVALELSGVAPEVLALLDMASLRRAPVVVYRLVFDASGQTLLAAPVFARGRLDAVDQQDTAGGVALLRASVETAARGLARGGGRVRSDADQKLIDAADDGLRNVSFAGQTTIYWGGKIPADARAAFGAVSVGGYAPGAGAYAGLGSFDNLNLMP